MAEQQQHSGPQNLQLNFYTIYTASATQLTASERSVTDSDSMCKVWPNLRLTSIRKVRLSVLFGAASQDLHARLRHQERLFKLGRELSIGRHCRPVVWPLLILPCAF